MLNSKSFKEGHHSSLFKDETGNKYGKLLVIKREDNSKFGTARWLCKCDCDNFIVVNAENLRNGKTKSCGCIPKGKVRSGDFIYQKLLRTTEWIAKIKGVPFDLTIEQLKEILHKKCEYCGCDPELERYAYHRTRYSKGIETDESILSNGVDRIVPEKGYVYDNCVPCCKYCNRAKSDLSVEQFKNMIVKIYNHYCK